MAPMLQESNQNARKGHQTCMLMEVMGSNTGFGTSVQEVLGVIG